MEDKSKLGTIVHGIAASEHVDSSGEVLDIQGMDISSLGSADSILNFEHNSKENPVQVCGKVTFAKKIFKKSDCDDKNQEHFWDFCQKPFVYIKGELFDHPDLDHDGAKNVAAMLRYDNRDKGQKTRKLISFSIEGGKIEKKGMIVTKSIARDVALTIKHCNKMCIVEILDDIKERKDLYKNRNEVTDMVKIEGMVDSFRNAILSDIKKSAPNLHDSYQQKIKNYKDTKSFKEKTNAVDEINNLAEKQSNQDPGSKPSRKFIEGTKNNMRKALIANIMSGSPDSKTGTAALTPEYLEGKLEKPFSSKAQRRFAHANPEKFGGKEGIKEWEEETPKDIPEKVKKSELNSLQKMSQPMLRNKDFQLGQDPRMDVKTVDPKKEYTSPSNPAKKISAVDLENKKIVNMAAQGKAGAQKRPGKQKQAQAQAQQEYGSTLDPSKQEGANLNVPGFGQRSFEFSSPSEPKTASQGKVQYSKKKYKEIKSGRPEENQLGAKVHEATHGFFTDIENKYSKEHASALSQRLLKENFHPKDLERVSSWLKDKQYKTKSPYFNEEHITHISDILNNPKDRHSFYKHLGIKDPQKTLKQIPSYIQALKTGKGMDQFSPQEINNIRQVRHIDKRLKRGWKNTADFVNNPLQLSDFFNQMEKKKKK